ncbi:MAG TPA: hypothetical protein VEP49_21940 [Acidimicrobiia bacterium]|nr:hypothetical protein [Acidimicrobiia bacterium]
MKRFFRRVLGVGVLAAIAYAVWRAYDQRRVDTGVSWEPQPFPYPPLPHSGDAAGAGDGATPEPIAAAPASAPPWVEPDAGACPASHPVKAKLASGIFHLPGGANYDRTQADRCYASEEAAVADGLRAAKN